MRNHFLIATLLICNQRMVNQLVITKRKKMSIKRLLLIGALLTTASLLLLATLLFITNTKQEQLYKSQVERYSSYLLADELRQSSDDLTRLARTYVMTGDDKYEKNVLGYSCHS